MTSHSNKKSSEAASTENSVCAVEELPSSKSECVLNGGRERFASAKFNFAECLGFLETTGKKIYGKKFHIYEEDLEIIFKLFSYFFQDTKNCQQLNLDLDKGVILTGPIGCGKTSLMNLVKFIRPPEEQHLMISTRRISFEFNKDGFETIEKYSTQAFKPSAGDWLPKRYCFDDLGLEKNIKYFGNECNVMAEILLSRYDLFISHNMLTFATTNLNSSEIEEIYGNRVRSRLREMMNLISFPSTSTDKRQ